MKKLIVALAGLMVCSLSAEAQKKPAPKPKAAAAPTALIAQGKAVYTETCLSCHQADGGGVDGMNPPLIKTSYVLGDKTRIVKVVLNGLQGVDIDGEEYNNAMPSYDFLTDQQIAAVLTYVRNSFGNKATAISAAEVKAIRAANKK
jgi:mono/diheme cytochrome c family protein